MGQLALMGGRRIFAGVTGISYGCHKSSSPLEDQQRGRRCCGCYSFSVFGGAAFIIIDRQRARLDTNDEDLGA